MRVHLLIVSALTGALAAAACVASPKHVATRASVATAGKVAPGPLEARHVVVRVASSGTAAILIIRSALTASPESADGDRLLRDGYWQLPQLVAQLKPLRNSARRIVLFEADPSVPFIVIKKLMFLAGKSGFTWNEFSVLTPDGSPGPIHRYGGLGNGGLSAPSGTLRPSLDPSLIEATIMKNLAAIQACYETALSSKPYVAGKLVVHFIIEPDGRVSSASMKSSTMHDDKVEQCVAERFTELHFDNPSGGGIVTVNYPLLFKSYP